MSDPDWLIRARAEGRVISETGVFCRPSGSLPVEDFGAKVALVPKAVSGSSAKPRGNKPALMPVARRSFTVVIAPLRLASEANAGGKLRDKIARKSAVKEAVKDSLPEHVPLDFFPVVVTLTRLGGRHLDGDNLARAMKAVRDVVAKWLGLDDADQKIRWRYRQKPDWQMGCKIHIREKR